MTLSQKTFLGLPIYCKTILFKKQLLGFGVPFVFYPTSCLILKVLPPCLSLSWTSFVPFSLDRCHLHLVSPFGTYVWSQPSSCAGP